jgi:peptidoglycan/xylan/chitin deacetylase (PgdA/CDA1 family)
MFNYRNTTFASLVLITAFGIFGLLLGNQWLLVAGLFLLIGWITILVLGSIFIQWNFYLFSYSHGDRNTPEIAITFDDGPDEKITPEILSILEKYNIKATFFCIGEKIEKHPELFKKIAEQGHITGNHSYSHSFWFDFYSSKRMEEEILRTDELILKLTGNKPKFFRHPYGVTNPMLKKALKRTGHIPVSWSLRSNDTVTSPAKVLISINQKLKNGDILLFHDSMPETPGLVEQFIIDTKNRGMDFAGLKELLKFKRYDNPTFKYL